MGYGCESFGERIVDLLGISDHHALAFTEDDMARDAYYRGIVRDIAEHNRARTDAAILAHNDVAEDLGASADDHVVFESGMTFPVFLAGTAESDSLIKGHVVADN